MTLIGGTNRAACAACKFQRRRCSDDCPLAPYFPAEQPKIFENAHKLYGVRSIVKILETLDEDHKPEAMKSIIFESYVRERSPVHGCLGLTHQLQYSIWSAEEELKAVNSQLQFYSSQANCRNNHNQMFHGNLQKQEGTISSQPNKVDVTQFFSPSYAHNNVPNTDPSKEILANNTFMRWGHDRFTHNDNIWFINQNEMKSNNNGVTAISPPYTDEILANNTCMRWGHDRYPYNDNLGFINQNEMKSNNNSVTEIQSQLVNLQMVQNKEDVEYNVEDEIDKFLQRGER